MNVEEVEELTEDDELILDRIWFDVDNLTDDLDEFPEEDQFMLLRLFMKEVLGYLLLIIAAIWLLLYFVPPMLDKLIE